MHPMDGMDNFFSGKGFFSVCWVSEGKRVCEFCTDKKLSEIVCLIENIEFMVRRSVLGYR